MNRVMLCSSGGLQVPKPLRQLGASPAPPSPPGQVGFVEAPFLLPVRTEAAFRLLVPRGASRALQDKLPAIKTVLKP